MMGAAMYNKILVAVDGSAASKCSLREAITLSVDQNAGLFLLNVVEEFSVLAQIAAIVSRDEMIDFLRECGKDVLDQARRIAAAIGVHAEMILRQTGYARVSEVIVNEARSGGYDLIVMGTHGRRGISRFALGSDAENVVRMSQVPVLLVRQG
jgi:nucleotide-binding universal stress UspA family protein